jgi:hypothetical protein
LPERAQLSLERSLGFLHLTSNVEAKAKVSIVLNQVAVWIDTEDEWNILDLRNVVKTMVQNELAMVGYLLGHAYDFEITRVINRERNVDWVFGIDIPCIAERRKSSDIQKALNGLNKLGLGKAGVFFHRCFSDLVSAMRHADDTGFYCYRALESLRLHCAARYGLSEDSKADQWAKFRAVTGCDKTTIKSIKDAADPVRHGDVANMNSSDRVFLLTNTWDVVDSYLNSIGAFDKSDVEAAPLSAGPA